ncbi:GxxExxY protein [Sorangium sp. So ce388]
MGNLDRARVERQGMNRQDAKDAKREESERYEPSEELDRVARRVIGAALEVHRLLGPGFLEGIYEEALCVELSLQRVPFARQVPIGIDYKGIPVGQARIDLVVAELVIVELKAVEQIAPIHVAQLLSYLKGMNLRLGLLITFNVSMLRTGIRRVIRTV